MQGDECQLKHIQVYNGLIKNLCKFYVTGFCMKAESCPYMHHILSLFCCYMSQTKVCWTIHELVLSDHNIICTGQMSCFSFTKLHSLSPVSTSTEEEDVLKKQIAGFPMIHLPMKLASYWMRFVHVFLKCSCENGVKKTCVSSSFMRFTSHCRLLKGSMN